MARPREPISLLEAKGRKHLTDKEINERRAQEVRAPAARVRAPNYLSKEEKKTFVFVAKILKEIGILSDLDIGILVRYVKSESEYLKITVELQAIQFGYDPEKKESEEEQQQAQHIKYDRLSKIQNRYMKACNECARELGLTISSRCKLVMPKAKEEEKPANKFLAHA